MGSGKTSIGKKMSKMIKFDFIDTDALIEQKTGLISQQFLSMKAKKALGIENPKY